MADQIAQFQQATGKDETEANNYLGKTGGDINKAIALFFEEHPHDACDGCGGPLIETATRHKCTICEDFELCDKCANAKFEGESHLASHPLVQKTRDRGWSFTKDTNKNPRGAFIANRK